jgi:diaminohydroxyphosphoribosylaminopyrimidine deaminase/5-amino-6-(5-phosphoribosylamino)uracil reductase
VRDWLLRAIELSRLCPPVSTAFSVGAIVVGADGQELASGYSRDTDPQNHAEESALGKLSATGRAATGATLYSSLEPCTIRRSRPQTCTELIIAAGITKVVFALREPPIFVLCQGVELLTRAGIEVVEIPALAALVREINGNVLGDW